MSTIQEPKKKTQKRFRVKIGDSYASLSYDFSEKGALVKCGGQPYATEFKRNVDAGNAIKRTLEIKNQVADSMHAGWKAFAPLQYEETPQVEEFEVIVALE
jgi:hypothetical protein